MKKVVIVGELLIDMISEEYVDDLSEARVFRRYFAGSPGNLAVNLKSLNIEPVLLASVGNDSFGKGYLRWLKEKNIDTSFIRIADQPTSIVIISKSKDTPQFIPIRGADYLLELPEDPDSLFMKVAFLHLTSWPLSMKPARETAKILLKMAAKKDVKICLDPNFRELLWEKGHDGRAFLKEIMKSVYLAKPSLDDSFHIFGKGSPERYVELFHSYGVENVVLTLGAEGVLISNGRTSMHIPAFAKNVVDTTGAGDAFWSGLYYGLLQGFDVFDAAKLGNAAAAFRIEHEDKSVPLPEFSQLKIIAEMGMTS
ncbi:carbohydrate kinase family protein [Kosmotoga pacifica]|nr:sugar kinase [Kosmotoga pacifica]